jgi:hypothetical protein
MMPLTTGTDIDVLCADPVGMVTAMGTTKPFGPFHFEKVIVTGLFTGKAVLKLDLTGREVFFHNYEFAHDVAPR